jgi:hypothetical protein
MLYSFYGGDALYLHNGKWKSTEANGQTVFFYNDIISPHKDSLSPITSQRLTSQHCHNDNQIIT